MKSIVSWMITLMLVFSCAAAETATGGTDTASNTLTIELKANITTGYQWTAFILGGDSFELDESNSCYVSDPNPELLDGVGGKHVFVFHAVKTGETLVRFSYCRSFENGEAESRLMLLVAEDDLLCYSIDVTESSLLTGYVSSVNTEEHSVIMVTETGDVNVLINDEDALPVIGEQINVYSNGTMTMSEPPIVHAIAWEAVASEEARVGIANPWTEVSSLDELNARLDMNLNLPGVMGVTDVNCRIMESNSAPLGEVNFKVNGMEYCLRGTPDTEVDISGVWLDDGHAAFEGIENEDYAIVVTETQKLARWINISGQYVLYITDDGIMDEDSFASIVNEMMDITNSYYPDALSAATYDDAFSQRAHAIVTPLGNDRYSIKIHWSNSCEDESVWTMTAEMTEDGKLVYSDCVKMHVVYDDDGNPTQTPANLIPDGYFVSTDTGFNWSGAAEEYCRNCVFEMNPVE